MRKASSLVYGIDRFSCINPSQKASLLFHFWKIMDVSESEFTERNDLS